MVWGRHRLPYQEENKEKRGRAGSPRGKFAVLSRGHSVCRSAPASCTLAPSTPIVPCRRCLFLRSAPRALCSRQLMGWQEQRGTLQWVHLLPRLDCRKLVSLVKIHLWPLASSIPSLNIHSISTYVWPGMSNLHISGVVWPRSCPKNLRSIHRRYPVELRGWETVLWGGEHRATQNTRSRWEICLQNFDPSSLGNGKGASQTPWFGNLLRSGLLPIPCLTQDTPQFCGGPPVLRICCSHSQATYRCGPVSRSRCVELLFPIQTCLF